MDSRGVMATVSEECQVLVCPDKVKGCCVSIESSADAEDILILRTSATGEERASMGPVTPDINGECRDPLTQADQSEHLSSRRALLNGEDESPQTPKDDVFDPFAPGSDNLLRAPMCKKQFNELRTSVARRLIFGSSPLGNQNKGSHEGLGTHISDEEMVESVYVSLLETIMENKIEDILAEMSTVEWADENCKTPLAPKLNGIAETCPGAPKKAAAKSKNIDLNLCRKLQF